MKVEKEVEVNLLRKRFDLLCYNNAGKPVLLCEFKRSTVTINESTFNQVARYNLSLQAPLVYVTNGLKHYIAEVNFFYQESFIFIGNSKIQQVVCNE